MPFDELFTLILTFKTTHQILPEYLNLIKGFMNDYRHLRILFNVMLILAIQSQIRLDRSVILGVRGFALFFNLIFGGVLRDRRSHDI
jgi:hypothetical protein